MRITLVIALLALGFAASCTPELGAHIDPALPLQDLGYSAIDEEEVRLDLHDPAAVWQAAEHAFPGMGWGLPMVQTVDKEILPSLMSQRVADIGSCPWFRIEDGAEVMVTECRSGAGYHWTGSTRTEAWSEAGLDYEGIRYDLEVSCDEEDRLFDRVALHGDVIVVRGTAPLLQHVQTNIAISYEGAWDRTPAEAWREDIWSDLRFEGWAEAFESEDEDGEPEVTWKTVSKVKAGHLGVLEFASEELRVGDACGAEPDGDSEVLASAESTFGFRGYTTCDSCVEYQVDGEQVTACPER